MATVRLVPQREMRDVTYGCKIDVHEDKVFIFRVYRKSSPSGNLSALDIDVSGREVEALAATKYVLRFPEGEADTKYEIIAECKVLLLARKAGTATVTVTPVFPDGSLGPGEVFEVHVT